MRVELAMQRAVHVDQCRNLISNVLKSVVVTRKVSCELSELLINAPLSFAEIFLNEVKQMPNVAEPHAHVVLNLVHTLMHCLLPLAILVVVLHQLLNVRDKPKQFRTQHVLGLRRPAE
jgi:hypothetical protein